MEEKDAPRMGFVSENFQLYPHTSFFEIIRLNDAKLPGHCSIFDIDWASERMDENSYDPSDLMNDCLTADNRLHGTMNPQLHCTSVLIPKSLLLGTIHSHIQN